MLLSLVVACANVVNLLLGLAGSRRHEMIVRAALGASRLQLVAPLLRESLMVGVVSGLIGYGVAAVALTKLTAWRPSLGMFPPPSFDVRPDIWVFAVTLGLSMAVGLGVGLVPALRAAAEGLSGSLHRENAAGGPARTRVRNVLVVIQMTIATVVLAAVGVSIHSFFKLQHLPLGFSARHLLYTSFNLQRGGYDVRTGPSMYARIREKVAAEPGISAVTLATDAPMMGYGNTRVVADVEAPPPDGRGVETPSASVDEQYATALGLTLLAGRFFDARDVPGRTETVVINQTMARKYWGSENAVGHHIRGGDQGHQFEVIGIVADGKYGDVDEPPLSFMYFPLAQHYQPDIVVIAQTTGPREAVAELVADLDQRLTSSGFGMVTLEDMLAISMLLSRVLLTATMTFAIIALGLAIFGLYSTVFYAVSQRRTEIGIRVAMGATPAHLFAMVLRQTGWVALAGAAAASWPRSSSSRPPHRSSSGSRARSRQYSGSSRCEYGGDAGDDLSRHPSVGPGRCDRLDQGSSVGRIAEPPAELCDHAWRMIRDILQELDWRGLYADCTDRDALDAHGSPRAAHALLRVRSDGRQPARRQSRAAAGAAAVSARRAPPHRARRRRDRHDWRSVGQVRRAQPAHARSACASPRRASSRSSRGSSISTTTANPARHGRTTTTGPRRCRCSSSCATSASTSR